MDYREMKELAKTLDSTLGWTIVKAIFFVQVIDIIALILIQACIYAARS